MGWRVQDIEKGPGLALFSGAVGVTGAAALCLAVRRPERGGGSETAGDTVIRGNNGRSSGWAV